LIVVYNRELIIYNETAVCVLCLAGGGEFVCVRGSAFHFTVCFGNCGNAAIGPYQQ